jgi:LysM repeat protein
MVEPERIAQDLESIAVALGSELRLDAADVAGALPSALASEPPTMRLRAFHRPRQHRVVEGDTIAGLAAAYGLPYPWIAERNPLAEDGLWPDQLLEIPPADALIPLPPVMGKRIRIDLSDQELLATQKGQELWRWPVSTGVSDSPTAPGVYQIRSRDESAYAPSWDLQMPFFLGIYPPMPDAEVMNGFHGFPTQGGAQLIWTDRIGSPATYGCVLLPTQRAEALFTWAELGVIVEIVE